MVDLSTTYGGVKLKNPLIIGGGPTSGFPELCGKAAKAGWGALVLKTNMADDIINRYPKIVTVVRPFYKLADDRGRKWKPRVPKQSDGRSRDGKKLGKIEPDYTLVFDWQLDPITGDVYSGHGGFYHGDDQYLKYISESKKAVKGTDCKIIASVTAFSEEGWEQQCNLVNRSDADIVEINLGCGGVGTIHPKTGKHLFLGMGNWPELVDQWTKFCVERIKGVPVCVKLPPHAKNPLLSAQTAANNGVVGIQFGDGGMYMGPIPGLAIDTDNERLGLVPGNPFISPLIPGSWTLPFICGFAAMARLNGIKQDISACGGIKDYSDILRVLLSGATSAQVCTASMVEGVGVAAEYLQGITSWMEKHKHNSLKEIIGKFATPDQLRLDPSQFAPTAIPQIMGGPTPDQKVVVNEKKCIKCGWCEQACLHLAISFDVKNPPVINDKACEVCGMCVALCPMEAISIEPRK